MGGIFKENEQINKESVFRTGTRKDLSKGMQLDDNVQPVSRSKSSWDLLRNAPVNEEKMSPQKISSVRNRQSLMKSIWSVSFKTPLQRTLP